jgi:hypothetical protein
MEGGEISNNTGNVGGGVTVDAGGTFLMKGGRIINNITAQGGGGVCIMPSTFIMTGGELSGNDDTHRVPQLGNNAGNAIWPDGTRWSVDSDGDPSTTDDYRTGTASEDIPITAANQQKATVIRAGTYVTP